MFPRERILILDDDRDLSFVIAECLAEHGHDCRVLDGFEAPEAETWRWADVAILDLRLAGRTDGTALLRRMETIAPAPALILSSGCDSETLENAVRDARKLGFSVRAALRKPFPFARLREALAGQAALG